jgi:deoxyribonucleoside regulator
LADIDFGDSRNAFLAQVASLYYDLGKNQQEIAEEVGLTRSGVSRLLTEARDKGIVEIIVHGPWPTVPDLERELMDRFGLKTARVIDRGGRSYEEVLVGLGTLAAEYFLSILTGTSVIGISWGTALYQMIRALRPVSFPSAEVVQLIGATGTERSATDGPILAQLLANRLSCTCRYLHAPLLIESETARESLLRERMVRETMMRMARVQVALVGVGSIAPTLSSMLRTGYLTLERLELLRAAGAVGDVCAQYYDIQGRVLDVDVNRLVIGIPVSELKRRDTVIGVAGDALKAEAILGALRGRFINVLVTDSEAARRVLSLDQTGG